MKPVLIIHVVLDDTYEVKGKNGSACMLLFHGTAEGELFRGRILPGAVDTQKKAAGGEKTLSARYILEGIDAEGRECRIFVENHAVKGDPETRPLIYTDSEALKWLETAELYGVLSAAEYGVDISFYERENG